MDKLKNMANRQIGRRDLLKALAATGGAIAAVTILPGKWAKPVIETGLLPAHAVGSTTSFEVILTWSDGVDLDLRVREPGGSEAVRGSNTTTLEHSGNDYPDTGGTGEETVTKRAELNNGTYQVYVDWVDMRASDISAQVEPDPQPSLTIITHKETKVVSPVPISSGQKVHAANVEFSSGSITLLV
jgi:hypothetical protein